MESTTIVSDIINSPIPAQCSGTMLHEAADLGAANAVRTLLKHGADVDARDYFNKTALHAATFSKRHRALESMEWLIKHNTFVDAQTVIGETPIFWACKNASPRKAFLLMNSGCVLNSNDNSRMSLLHAVAEQPGNTGRELFPELVRRGLDIHKLWDKRTPVQKAMMLFQYASLMLNGDYGVESMTRFIWRTSEFAPLYVSWVGHPFRLYRRRIPLENLKTLVSRSDPDEVSALYFAARLDCEVSLINLLDFGIDPDSEGGLAGTPLMAACEQGSLRAVKILVRAGASIRYQSDCGEVSAVTRAGCCQKIVNWLLVGRFVDQRRLESKGGKSLDDGEDIAELHPWGGIARKMMRGVEWSRQFNESWMAFLVRIHRLRRDMRGKIVPISTSVPAGEIPVDWCFEKDNPQKVHVQLDLKPAKEGYDTHLLPLES